MNDDTENNGQALKDLIAVFPTVSKRWLASRADQGANVISNQLLDGVHEVPQTTGDMSMMEEPEDEEEEVVSATFPTAAAAATARAAPKPRAAATGRKAAATAAAAPPSAAGEPRRSTRIRKRRESEGEETEDDTTVEIPRETRRRAAVVGARGGVKQRKLATLEERDEEGEEEIEMPLLSEEKEKQKGRRKKVDVVVIGDDSTPDAKVPPKKAPAKAAQVAPRVRQPAAAAMPPVVAAAAAPAPTTVVPKPVEEEEPAIDEEAAEVMTRMAQLVDMKKFEQLQFFFPEVSLGWLLQHADCSEERIFEIVDAGNVDRKLVPRADGRGVTTIIKTALAARKTFECVVCFGDYEEHLAISCVLIKKRESLLPGEIADAVRVAEREAAARKGQETHSFCAECVSGHARAAVEQQVIVAAGHGLKCMDPSCKNTLLRAHIEQVLDARTRAVIDPMLNEEALLAADCEDVEKCQKCSFGAVIEQPRDIQPVFACQNAACRHTHCRQCGRQWTAEHKGKKCEELDPEAIRRRVEEQLAEASMFRCPRCKKPIVKLDGCNKIACPCGQLSCYVCKAAIKDYKHFQNGPTADGKPPTKCQLWVDPTAQVEANRLQLLQEQIGAAKDANVKDMLERLQ
ncbi:hypothetical protein PFISCL1PPCAC_20658 [Pristionchus fissidentatus]|uniref:RING-type domain-containing protein n=1 Tax=Pristionchus fissidentatus TaxID=1538716 RepID=A0AAV5WEQ6_9BILA|nr:hypothetical protein PFISCL1PPCAC_20658 [Pristionchus fissidentatus]